MRSKFWAGTLVMLVAVSCGGGSSEELVYSLTGMPVESEVGGECEEGATKGCVTSCTTVGIQYCIGNEWGYCEPPLEICDNLTDDDCDGSTDELGCQGEYPLDDIVIGGDTVIYTPDVTVQPDKSTVPDNGVKDTGGQIEDSNTGYEPGELYASCDINNDQCFSPSGLYCYSFDTSGPEHCTKDCETNDDCPGGRCFWPTNICTTQAIFDTYCLGEEYCPCTDGDSCGRNMMCVDENDGDTFCTWSQGDCVSDDACHGGICYQNYCWPPGCSDPGNLCE
jgi:hypothetical protein